MFSWGGGGGGGRGKKSERNAHFSDALALYILNNILGLACLRTDMMRGDLGRHGVTEEYEEWSKTYESMSCITTETRTQGLIEKHNASLKNVYLEKKNDRLDSVIQSLYAVHISLKRQYEIESARQTPRKDSQGEEK